MAPATTRPFERPRRAHRGSPSHRSQVFRRPRDPRRDDRPARCERVPPRRALPGCEPRSTPFRPDRLRQVDTAGPQGGTFAATAPDDQLNNRVRFLRRHKGIEQDCTQGRQRARPPKWVANPQLAIVRHVRRLQATEYFGLAVTATGDRPDTVQLIKRKASVRVQPAALAVDAPRHAPETPTGRAVSRTQVTGHLNTTATRLGDSRSSSSRTMIVPSRRSIRWLTAEPRSCRST